MNKSTASLRRITVPLKPGTHTIQMPPGSRITQSTGFTTTRSHVYLFVWWRSGTELIETKIHIVRESEELDFDLVTRLDTVGLVMMPTGVYVICAERTPFSPSTLKQMSN